MNDRTSINPIPREWLTAYADDQLDAATRRRVAAWLSDHPEALTELENQENLSPTNVDYWQSVAPPLPSKEQWDQAFSHIADKVLPTAPMFADSPPTEAQTLPNGRGSDQRTKRSLSRSWAIAGTAAVLLIAVLVVDRQRAGNRRNGSVLPNGVVQRAQIPENDDEDLVFQVASTDDVELIQLPEAAAAFVVVGRHPMADAPLLLASSGDLQLLNYGPDDQGNLPDIETTLGPNASMLWAPSTKP